MDSSNSGSFQSSSGGAAAGGGGDNNNEEYDSRTQSNISSFLNPSTHFNPNLNHLLRPPPQPPSSNHHHHHHHPPTTDHNNTPLFHSSFSHPSNPNPNPLHDLDSVWTRPDPNFGSTRNQTHPQSTFDTYPINPNSSRLMDTNTNTKTGRGSDHHHHHVTIKNPKKRTRASRRAPTTVLTTDTTNFRQMVQEFTGIPTAPFTAASSSSSSPFTRRLDLFGGGGGTTSFYPLRPSAHKIQQQQPPSFLNSMANIIIESGTSNNNISNSTPTTSSNYELPPSDMHEFQKQPSTLLDLQNPMLSFQSLLQTTLPQQSNQLSGFPPSSSKRWRGQDEKVDGFEGVIGNNQNLGGSKLSSGLENVVVSSRSGGDQVQGNEDSWICPSN